MDKDQTAAEAAKKDKRMLEMIDAYEKPLLAVKQKADDEEFAHHSARVAELIAQPAGKTWVDWVIAMIRAWKGPGNTWF